MITAVFKVWTDSILLAARYSSMLFRQDTAMLFWSAPPAGSSLSSIILIVTGNSAF